MNEKTYKYFKDRERKHQEQKIKDDEKFSKVLEKEYQRTLREIENRMNWWIGKYADDNEIYIEQARQIVREADIKELKEKAKEYVKNKDVSTKANKEMRIYNLKMKIARDELLQKYIDLELAKLGTKEEKLLEDRIFNETEEELKRQAGILRDSLISKEKVKSVFEQIVNDSHVSAHFSNYIWTNIKELRNDLQNGLNRSILRGQNPNVWKSDLYKHFRGRIQKAEFAARRLSVTETAIAQTKAGLISAKENGYDKVIVITEPGACKDCKPHDGKIVDIDEAKMGDNVPIWHPFCRCTVAAYYEYEDEILNTDDLFRKNNDLSRIGKPQSVDSIDKLKKISKSGIINMNNSEEIKAYIEDNYQVSIRGFDKVSLDENKIIFSGIDDMIKKYPEIENSLSTVIYDEKIKDDGLLRGLSIHIGKTGLNYETIIHELSHVMDKQRSAGSNFDYSKSILMEARKRLGLRSNSKKYEKLAYEIVGYVTKNAKLEEEVFAYSLETELVNSSVGNELSRTIKEIVDVYDRRTN